MAKLVGMEIKTDSNLISFTDLVFCFSRFSKELFLLLSLCIYLTTLCHEKDIWKSKMLCIPKKADVSICAIILQLVFRHISVTVGLY